MCDHKKICHFIQVKVFVFPCRFPLLFPISHNLPYSNHSVPHTSALDQVKTLIVYFVFWRLRSWNHAHPRRRWQPLQITLLMLLTYSSCIIMTSEILIEMNQLLRIRWSLWRRFTNKSSSKLMINPAVDQLS